MSTAAVKIILDAAARSIPRVAFLGLGWIGQHRMRAAIEAGALEPVAFIEPNEEMAGKAAEAAPKAQRLADLSQIEALNVDGLVIATPSAAHAEQSIVALDMGLAVFCQKPLGRTQAEVTQVLQAAKRADRLLAVDLSYRFTQAARLIRELISAGTLGRLYAIDLVFHNAYGPDKPWFYQRKLSGGGCVMDLGVHLVDLALWATGQPEADGIDAQLFSAGERLRQGEDQVEDFAFAAFRLGRQIAVRLTCSWRLHAGQDAVISAAFYGDQGAAEMRNVGGSFYDFTAEGYQGTSRALLCQPPDAWGGRALIAWAERLRESKSYDPAIEPIGAVAGIIDGIYASGR